MICGLARTESSRVLQGDTVMQFATRKALTPAFSLILSGGPLENHHASLVRVL